MDFAFYGSGQLLTEDYYVANKLIKGFIGSANMETRDAMGFRALDNLDAYFAGRKPIDRVA